MTRLHEAGNDLQFMLCLRTIKFMPVKHVWTALRQPGTE